MIGNWNLSLVFLAAALQTPSLSQAEGSPHVCIIGSGISAASTAYFLKADGIPGSSSADYCAADRLEGLDLTLDEIATLRKDDTVRISVFEKDHPIGGRIEAFRYHGEAGNSYVEAGGSVIHCENQYIMGFARLLNLTTILPKVETDRFGVFDGKDMFFKSSKVWSGFDKISLGMRYGMDLVKLQTFVNEKVQAFNKVYEVQNGGMSFSNPVDLFKHLGLYDLTQKDLHSALSEAGVGDQLINELVTSIIRVNYNQGPSVNGLAGAVGLAGSGEKLRKIDGIHGNRQILDRIYDLVGATVHTKKRIERIAPAKGDNRYTLHDQEDKTYECDAVVIAAPLQSAQIELGEKVSNYLLEATEFPDGTKELLDEYYANLKAKGIDVEAESDSTDSTEPSGDESPADTTEDEKSADETTVHDESVLSKETEESGTEEATYDPNEVIPYARDYKGVIVSFIEGKLNDEYFGEDPPNVILTTEAQDLPFSSIGLQVSNEGCETQDNLYKVFTTKVLSKEDLLKMFAPGHLVHQVFPWVAYPRFNPPEAFSPFVLDKALFYVNSIESGASAMEVCAVGGRNAALLVQKQLSLKPLKFGDREVPTDTKSDEL